MATTEATAQATADCAALLPLLEARVYLYTLFHKAFGGKPTRELVDLVASADTQQAVAAFAEADETFGKLGAFAAALADRADDAQLMWDIEAEYTRALVGPGELPGVPWESPYLSHEAALVQESTLAVRRLMRQAGYEPKFVQHVPDDHVSLLCAFAAEQARAALEAVRAGDWAQARALLEDQCAFCRDHLASWLPRYAEKLCTMRTAHLYPQLAKGLAAFAQADLTLTAQAVVMLDEWASAGVDPEAPAWQPALADALSELQAVRLFGLEENELREL